MNQLISDSDAWSYTIMGSEKAWELWDSFYDIILAHATRQENLKFPNSFPKILYCEIINTRCFDELVEFTFKHGSRLAFQVFGWVILNNGVKMPEDIRELILAHSKWEDERDQIDNEKDRTERKRWLLDFQERVKNYVEGIPVRVPHETRRDVYRKNKSRIRLYIERRQVRKNTKKLFKK